MVQLTKVWENFLLIFWFASHFRDISFLLVIMMLLVFEFLTVSYFQTVVLYGWKYMSLSLESLIAMLRDLLGQPLSLLKYLISWEISGSSECFMLQCYSNTFALELYSTDLQIFMVLKMFVWELTFLISSIWYCFEHS